MANAAPVRANILRITRTDACGTPVAEATANSRVTTAGFITVGLAADVFTSSDIQVAAASGAICIRSKGVPSLLGFDVTLTLCDFNQALMELLLGAPILTDYADPVEDVGGVIDGSGAFNDSTVMVEWFSGNGKNDACTAPVGTNPQRPYIHSVLPRVNRWVLGGNLDYGDSETTVTLNGYAEPSTAFAASRAADEWTAADIAAMNGASALFAYREVVAIPTATTAGYDA